MVVTIGTPAVAVGGGEIGDSVASEPGLIASAVGPERKSAASSRGQ